MDLGHDEPIWCSGDRGQGNHSGQAELRPDQKILDKGQ